MCSDSRTISWFDTASYVILCLEKKMQLDPTGWWLSEKYDGIRAYWDGNGKLYFRTGKEIHAPRTFLRLLPVGLPLDGELW